MSKEIKNIALPINKIEYSKSNKNLIKCTIYVMHTGENLNYSSFSEESVLKAKESLKNVPILANIKHDEDLNPTDFGGHDMDLHIIERASGDCEFKTVYTEKPVGVIPETNNYRIETLENGERWVVVEGFIWKEYSDSHELLTRTDKKVSMEINVNSGFFDDNFMYHIEDYEYLGVTILGDDCPPAMGENATISLFNKSEDFKVEYTKLLEEVKNFEEGGIEVEDNKELEIVEATEIAETEEVKAEVVEESVVEEVTENDEVEETKGEEEKEDSEVETEPETVIEEKEDFEHKYNEAVKELNELKAKYTDLKSDYDILQEENKELANFKLNIEKEQKDIELNSVFEEYSALNKVEGYSSLFEKRYELDKEELIKSLKVLAFDNNININVKNKKDFSKNSIKIPVVSVEKDINRSTAWDILEKHIK